MTRTNEREEIPHIGSFWQFMYAVVTSRAGLGTAIAILLLCAGLSGLWIVMSWVKDEVAVPITRAHIQFLNKLTENAEIEKDQRKNMLEKLDSIKDTSERNAKASEETLKAFRMHMKDAEGILRYLQRNANQPEPPPSFRGELNAHEESTVGTPPRT